MIEIIADMRIIAEMTRGREGERARGEMGSLFPVPSIGPPRNR
jgi:hypothetical protein